MSLHKKTQREMATEPNPVYYSEEQAKEPVINDAALFSHDINSMIQIMTEKKIHPTHWLILTIDFICCVTPTLAQAAWVAASNEMIRPYQRKFPDGEEVQIQFLRAIPSNPFFFYTVSRLDDLYIRQFVRQGAVEQAKLAIKKATGLNDSQFWVKFILSKHITT